jgi:hypothetical protein
MDDFKENVIEFLLNDKTATVTFTQGRFITRIKELAKRKPDKCQITAENADGSIVAHIPTSWVKINPEKELSEEQREKFAERARQMTVRRMG